MTPPPPATAIAEPLAPPRSAPSRSRRTPERAPRGPVVRRPALRRPRVAAPSRSAVAGAGAAGAGLLARLFSGRRLILLLGAALIGLVFLQVTLLRINTQMSADVEKAQLLQRDNASKRALIAQMGAGRRVEDAAAKLGMVMPAATEVCYLKIGRRDNCPDGLSAVSGDSAAGTTADGTTSDATTSDGATTDGGAATGDPSAGQDQPAASPPATQEAPTQQAPAQQAPQSQPGSGGLAAGTGGGG